MKGYCCYLLAYSEDFGDHENVRKFIDKRPEIVNWKRCFLGTYFIVSDRSAYELTDILREFSKDKGNFIVADLNTDRNGFLPRAAWEFIRNPKPVDDEE